MGVTEFMSKRRRRGHVVSVRNRTVWRLDAERSVHSVVSGTIHPPHPHPSPTPTSYPTLRRARTYYRRRALRSRTRVEAARAGAGPAHKTQ